MAWPSRPVPRASLEAVLCQFPRLASGTRGPSSVRPTGASPHTEDGGPARPGGAGSPAVSVRPQDAEEGEGHSEGHLQVKKHVQPSVRGSTTRGSKAWK